MKLKVFCTVFLATGVALALLCSQASAASSLSRNLRQGDQGEDVRLLQYWLNQDPATLVSVTGAGSFGQETPYFGVKTKEAVKSFQRKYAKDILVPAGLTEPTGFVGVLTRAKLAKLMASSQTLIPSGSSNLSGQTPPATSVQPPAVVTTPTFTVPILTALTPTTAKPGDTVYVTGSGFALSGNSVEFGGQSVVAFRSSGGTYAQFTVPASAQPGSYQLQLRNSYGLSNSLNFVVSSSVAGGVVSGVTASTSTTTASGLFTFSVAPNITEAEFSGIVSSFAATQGQVLGAAVGPLAFGGLIIFTLPCANGVLLTIGPPRPGLFMFTPPVSVPFSYYQLVPGPWSLGLSDGVPTACVLEGPNIPALGTILIMGTSKL